MVWWNETDKGGQKADEHRGDPFERVIHRLRERVKRLINRRLGAHYEKLAENDCAV